jgi:Holliday junction resolvasome RuvABC endonuclease subunit
MMLNSSQHRVILGISPSARGFGFAIFEAPGTLIDWGVKSVSGDKNAEAFAKVVDLISHYQPDSIAIEDTTLRKSRRTIRIKKLNEQIVSVAKTRGVNIALLSRQQIQQFFFVHGVGTKHALAELLAERFSEELASRLPPKRRPWMSEDYRMGIFEAVALCIVSCETTVC